MLKPKITLLPGHIQSVYVQNLLKLYGNVIKAAEDDNNNELLINEVGQIMVEKLPMFVQSADLEVQERVSIYTVNYVCDMHTYLGNILIIKGIRGI